MNNRLLIGAIVSLGIAWAGAASAQDQIWLKDRRFTEGMGVRAGDLELHPGLAAEAGYDSNYFLRSSKYPAPNGPIGALRFRLTPSLALSTISQQRREGDGGAGEPPKLTFRAGAAATYNELIATNSDYSSQVSSQRNVGWLANLSLAILPQRPWGADLFADFTRTVQPSTDPDNNFNRMDARFGGGVIWTPGGGMFDWRLGYQYTLSYFEDTLFRSLSTGEHQANTKGRWRFLPRTALMYDATLGFLRYNNPDPGRLNSTPVRARLGMNGLITQSFGVLAMAGWGSSFYTGAANAQQFDSIIAQAELTWFITANPSTDPAAASQALSSISVGYVRDFVNSYISDFYRSDRFYARASYFAGGKFLLQAEGGAAMHAYSTAYDQNRNALGTGGFNETRVDATAFGEYRFADSFGVNATLRYTANLNDVRITLPGAAGQPATTAYLDWTRVEAYLGLRWFL
jgi:hypothetical protein